jgi:putative addiction module killer protein
MLTLRQTRAFKDWFATLRDVNAKRRIAQRLVRIQAGLFGDVKPVGAGVSELRIDHGPGYRVYFIQRGDEVIILLCGGDKSSQDRDIRAAKSLAQETLEDDDENDCL